MSRKTQIHSRDSRTYLVCALLALLVLFFGSSTSAADSATEVASTHYETGLALYGLGHFEDAVSEFRKAYEVQARAEFLLHIGRSFEQLGQSDKALYFFKRYLSTAPPEATEREEAQAFVSRFESAHPVLSSQETAAVSAPAEPLPLTTESHGEPLWQRWWVWAVIGGLVVATAGVGIALARGADEGPPQSDLGHMRF